MYHHQALRPGRAWLTKWQSNAHSGRGSDVFNMSRNALGGVSVALLDNNIYILTTLFQAEGISSAEVAREINNMHVMLCAWHALRGGLACAGELWPAWLAK